ncbi:MAG: ribosome maturation factor RimP [Fulvivirga sp.]|nr:ribosome maturation factor RimP [Fulvivirga sp.]
MELRDQVHKIAQDQLADDSHFIVDVTVSKSKGPKKVAVLLDGDQGVTIDDCANLSRSVSAQLEAEDLIDGAYTLEVSSPGVDFPLQSERQYKKNVGRQLKVTLEEGKPVKGRLESYNDTHITLTQEKGKGKKKETKTVEIPLENIKKTIVQISFK